LLYTAIYAYIISLYKYKSLFCSIDTGIRDSDIKMIGNLEKLEKLDLSRTNITDNGLQYICGLKELVCWDCKRITNSGLKKFIESSPKLELLDIGKCRNINKAYIRKIAKATCKGRSNNVSLIVL